MRAIESSATVARPAGRFGMRMVPILKPWWVLRRLEAMASSKMSVMELGRKCQGKCSRAKPIGQSTACHLKFLDLSKVYLQLSMNVPLFTLILPMRAFIISHLRSLSIDAVVHLPLFFRNVSRCILAGLDFCCWWEEEFVLKI